jgi:hypothetical protein
MPRVRNKCIQREMNCTWESVKTGLEGSNSRVLEVILGDGSVGSVGCAGRWSWNRNLGGTQKRAWKEQKVTKDGSWKLESRNRVDLA